MAQILGAASPAVVRRNLQGLRFPAYKRQLSQHLRKRGLDEAVCNSIEELPEREYHDVVEVMDAIARRRDARGRGDRGQLQSARNPMAHRTGGQITSPASDLVRGGFRERLQYVLRDLRFPNRSRVLAQQAQANGADDRMTDVLLALPERSFDNVDELLAAIAELHEQRERLAQLGPAPASPPARTAIEALRGAVFPAWRDDLLQRAEANRASPDMLDAIAQLPERHFADMSEVQKTLAGGADSSRQSRDTPSLGRTTRPKR